jgi:hypothetical protein
MVKLSHCLLELNLGQKSKPEQFEKIMTETH